MYQKWLILNLHTYGIVGLRVSAYLRKLQTRCEGLQGFLDWISATLEIDELPRRDWPVCNVNTLGENKACSGFVSSGTTQPLTHSQTYISTHGYFCLQPRVTHSTKASDLPSHKTCG